MKKILILVFMFILSISTIVFAGDLIDTTSSIQLDLVNTQVSDTDTNPDTTSTPTEINQTEDTSMQTTQEENTVQNVQTEESADTPNNVQQDETTQNTTIINTQDSNKMVISQPNISTNTSSTLTTILSVILIIIGIAIIILAIVIIVKM